MKVVKTRSPFIITIEEPSQLWTQIKLYIWNKGDVEPTIPIYVLSKPVPDLINTRCDFNISKYLQEFIEPIAPVHTDIIDQETNNCWCLFKVERYAGGPTIKDVILIDHTSYVGINGFIDYDNGRQNYLECDYVLMDYNHIEHQYPIYNFGYFNLLVDTNREARYNIKYANIDESYDWFTNYDGIQLLRIPYTNAALSNPNLACEITIDYSIDDIIITTPIEECKYEPIKCNFINERGGWQFLTFFKAQTNSIQVKGSEFNLLPDSLDYNIQRGQSKVFNLNGNQTIKCNTGWIDESLNQLIHDLLLSETVLIDDKPAKVKTQSITYKTQLKDKMINYEIDFEYAYDLINNVL